MRNTVIIGMLLIALSATLFIACAPPAENAPIWPLFNESANQQIENLTNITDNTSVEFQEFYFDYEPRPEAKYEIAKDDIFSLSKGNFTSTEISFFGVMLGDSYESVIERLGKPDMIYTPADRSYKNLQYRNAIGIGAKEPGMIIHIENDTVTIINIRPSFAKYLNGNMSIGVSKEVIYNLLDIPDYQSFVTNYRVFYYVEKGVSVYLKANDINVMTFYYPYDFKGVKYVTVQEDMGGGIVVNVTKPIPNK